MVVEKSSYPHQIYSSSSHHSHSYIGLPYAVSTHRHTHLFPHLPQTSTDNLQTLSWRITVNKENIAFSTCFHAVSYTTQALMSVNASFKKKNKKNIVSQTNTNNGSSCQDKSRLKKGGHVRSLMQQCLGLKAAQHACPEDLRNPENRPMTDCFLVYFVIRHQRKEDMAGCLDIRGKMQL